MVKTKLVAALAVALLSPMVLAHSGHRDTDDPASAPTPNPHCWPTQNPHDYWRNSRFFLVYDSNVADRLNDAPLTPIPVADGNQEDQSLCTEPHDEPSDRPGVYFDGDMEFGTSGGFFPAGYWANEPICQRGLADHHHTDVHVHDVIFPPGSISDPTGVIHNSIPFAVGADPSPPMVVQLGSDLVCVTDGSVSPQIESDDWYKSCWHRCDLSAPADNVNSCFGCPGGDGGYWVWTLCAASGDGRLEVHEDGSVTFVPPTVVGLGYCSEAGHIYMPDTIGDA